MPNSQPYRFGVNLFGIGDREAFRAKCQRAERRGFDILNIPDHLHAAAPFPMAVAAAEATERVRVGTHVLNIGFWNPALLAREIATTDQLTGGRLDIGLGGGTVKAEFDEAGIPWEPIGERMDRLETAIAELNRILGEEDGSEREPRPVQRPRPPIMVGASGERGLRVAARHADILGYGGVQHVRGKQAGTLQLATAATGDERMTCFRAQAGGRVDGMELSLLLQRVTLTADRKGAAEEWYAGDPSLTVEELLEAPGLLVGTVDEIVQQIHERRERYGFTYFSVHEPSMDAMEEVIAALRG
ncbi:MAG: TIGR03621 family F420-dependent LLM class oxidoreductase [Streptosporangiales bacterium]